MGFLVKDVPVGHADFGKVFPCPGPVHTAEHRRRLAAVSGLAEKDLDLTLDSLRIFDDVSAELHRIGHQFLKNPWGFLYIWGGPGNGKTLLLKALTNEFNKSGILAVYAHFSDILWWLREAFGKEDGTEEYLRRVNNLLEANVLLIDEFDKVNLTNFAFEFRYRFLDQRYEQGIQKQKHTVFASNDSPQSFPEYIYDRLRDGRFRIFANTGASIRPLMR